MSETRRFDLGTILSVTTGKLLTKPEGPRDNGIHRIYELLGWMTDDRPLTHQIGRFAGECKPWLLRWFPELAPCGVESSLASLKRWVASCAPGHKYEGVKMWLAEQRLMFTAIREQYDVPRIPMDDHDRKDPYDELVAMRGTDEGISVIRRDGMAEEIP